MQAPRLDRLLRRVVIIEALVAALLVSVSVGLYLSTQSVQSRSDDVNQTLLELQELRGEVLSAETGLRGYILSGRLIFLQPYVVGNRRVQSGVARVVDALPSDRQSEARAIGTKFVRWRTTFAEPVLDRIARDDRAGAQPMIVAGVGKQQIDDIRSSIANLSGREVRRLRDEQDRADTLQAVGLSLIALLSLTAVAVGVLLLRVLRRQVVHPVEELAAASTAFGAGDLAARAPVEGVLEARVAAEAFNQMAGRLGRTVDELRELDELKTRFVSTVSHELRTPLTSIMGFAEELTDEADTLSETQQEAVEVIVRNAGHLEAIINDLLLLSSLESGRVALRRTPVDIGDLVTELCRELEPLARDHAVRLTPTTAGRLELVGDHQRLRQAAANLINNAIKFSPAEADVAVSARRDGAEILIEVQDCGPGVPEPELAQLGRRFFRASTAHGVSGTGLGLAITRELVERHERTPGDRKHAGRRVDLPHRAPRDRRDRRAPGRNSGARDHVAVPEPTHRLDRLAVDVAVEALAQAPDDQLHLLALDVRVPPHEIDDLIGAQDLVGVAHERGEQPELRRGQTELLPARDDDGALAMVHRDRRVDVHVELIVASPARLAQGGAPQQRVDPCAQLLAAERLGDEVVRPAAQPADPVELVTLRGQHQHRHVAQLANPFEHLPAVHPGQTDVEDDDIRPLVEEGPQAGLAVAGEPDIVTRALHQPGDEPADVRVVLDHQHHAHGRGIYDLAPTDATRPRPARIAACPRPASSPAVPASSAGSSSRNCWSAGRPSTRSSDRSPATGSCASPRISASTTPD